MARLIQAENMEQIALGAAVLGTGGGGNPYVGKLIAMEALQQHGPVTMVDISEVQDDDLIVPSAMMGAPTVMVEKIPKGDEIIRAFQALERALGRRITHTMSIEAGGLNSTTPFSVAATLGLPLVDCDAMGRAFPEIQHVTLTMYGISATPFTLADEKGNSLLINTINNVWTERFARTATVEMGCSAMLACYPMTGKQLKEAAVAGTLTKCQEIGRAIQQAHRDKTDPVGAVARVTGGFRIFKGKVADVRRGTVSGFARGEAVLDGQDHLAGRTCRVKFQNEFLAAVTAEGVLCSAPDLITMLDVESGEPITTEELRYGFRIEMLGIPCDHRWRTPAGLKLVGPRYFGYDFDYVPVEALADGIRPGT